MYDLTMTHTLLHSTFNGHHLINRPTVIMQQLVFAHSTLTAVDIDC